MGAFPKIVGPHSFMGGVRARGVAEVKRLAALPRDEYSVVRKTAAARLGLSPPTLDDLSNQQPPELPNREPPAPPSGPPTPAADSYGEFLVSSPSPWKALL